VIELGEALATGPIVLDGGLATQLESQGHDLSSALWSARLLSEDPQAIVAAHRAYIQAGAQVITTASYQASLPGFAAAGIDQSAAETLIRSSVRLAQQARSEAGVSVWVAGSVGPYGASLADGSEYRGDYGMSVAALRAWHRPRIALLVEAGAEVLALETIPCLAEVEALLAEIDGSGVPAWLSLTCAGDRTRAGEPVVDAYLMAGSVGEVVATGVNCSDPRDVDLLVPLAARSDKPVVAYPNSGEGWDATARKWVGSPDFEPAAVHGWVADGARLVGGCCRVGPAQIAGIRACLTGAARPPR
jgi:homocysteine S-methyltransferase